MTLYQITQYIQYRWKAKGRHGTHSPFVYAFVEDVLHQSPNEALLVEHIIRYFGFKKAGELELIDDGQIEYRTIPTYNTPDTDDSKKNNRLSFNELFLIKSDPTADHLFSERHLSKMQCEDVLIIKDIYKTEACKHQWEHVKKDQRVKLSIDIFSIGILFFRNEFKEKQDFVLK